jgi:predicted RNA binding protein YcfA (HicA-like mRNA interferase family)
MTKKLPAVNARQVASALERAGFVLIRQTGSHRIFGHPDQPELRVTVPFHGNRDLKTGTVRGILKQADLTVERFVDLL